MKKKYVAVMLGLVLSMSTAYGRHNCRWRATNQYQLAVNGVNSNNSDAF